MKTEFTQGPWTSMKCNSGKSLIFGRENCVAVVEDMAVTSKSTEANTALIATAPELWEVLHSIWVNIPSNVIEQYGVKEEEIVAVLSKAANTG